jgi:hypothetical protein
MLLALSSPLVHILPSIFIVAIILLKYAAAIGAARRVIPLFRARYFLLAGGMSLALYQFLASTSILRIPSLF